MITYQCPLFAASEPPTPVATTASTAITASAALKINVVGQRPQNRLLDGPKSDATSVPHLAVDDRHTFSLSSGFGKAIGESLRLSSSRSLILVVRAVHVAPLREEESKKATGMGESPSCSKSTSLGPSSERG